MAQILNNYTELNYGLTVRSHNIITQHELLITLLYTEYIQVHNALIFHHRHR